MISVFMDGQADAVAHQLEHLPNAEHVRLQTRLVLASDDMDDSRPDNLTALQYEARRLLAAREHEIDAVVDRLTN
jgi:hypothetical protein